MSKVDGNLIVIIGDHAGFLGPMNPVIFPITESEIPAFGELLFLPERYCMPSKSTYYDSNMLSLKTVTKMIEHLAVVYSSIYTTIYSFICTRNILYE